MKLILELFSIGVFSLLITLLTTPMLRKMAVKLNLVDKPNYRKVHYEPTPLIGGIVIGLVFFLCSFLFIKEALVEVNYFVIFGAAYILLLVGIVDDKNDVSAKYKLAIQLLLSFFIAFNGIRITSFYGLFGIETIDLWAQYLLTIVVITGVVNAFNLMDGVDGLVGGLSLLGFLLLLLGGLFYDMYLSKIAIAFIGAIIGFLKFNFSKLKIFMGDSGSLFLGFLLVTLGIRLLEKQVNNPVQNYFYLFLILVSFFAIPVLDSVRVYLGRIKEGYSPFKADKTHLHHLLLQVGLTHKKIALSISFFSVFLSVVGFSLLSLVPITLSVIAIFIVFWTGIKFLLVLNNLFKWRKMVQLMETNGNL